MEDIHNETKEQEKGGYGRWVHIAGDSVTGLINRYESERRAFFCFPTTHAYEKTVTEVMGNLPESMLTRSRL